jgi:hypothetical protein
VRRTPTDPYTAHANARTPTAAQNSYGNTAVQADRSLYGKRFRYENNLPPSS